MTKLTFEVGTQKFDTLKEATAFRNRLIELNGEDGEWGVPFIHQVYTEALLEPKGVSKFEGFVNPKLKIKRA